MSNHKRRGKTTTKRQSSRQTSVYLIGGIVLLAVVVFIVARGIVVSSNTTPPQVTGSARIQVEQTLIDYGDMKYGTHVNPVFQVRNVGDQPLLILNSPKVQVVKGCCPPNVQLSTKTINPGETATLSINFTMTEGMGGPHQFNIELRTNDPHEPSKQLIVLSNWVA
ncbi:MAG: DUF1573 domain-containing protein [Anaerolineae bacterium]|nr:DUF1573 domain-containing protein [Anaerolineae bacterium]